MLSSICVATITGLPAARAMRVICFCSPGTFSTGISTPRSPRATMMPSDAAMMSSRSVMADGFSILDRIAARCADQLARPRACPRRAARTTARSSRRRASARARGRRGPFRSAARSAAACRAWRCPCGSPACRRRSLRRRSACRLSRSRACAACRRRAAGMAGLDGLEDLRVRQEHAVVAAGRLVAIEAEDRSVGDEHAAAAEFADAELRALQVGRGCRSGGGGARRTRARCCTASCAPSCDEWLMLMRNTSTPARNRRSIISGAAEAGPSVATILTRRLRLIFPCFPCPSGSVRRMVHSFASPVSTSKNPVRL